MNQQTKEATETLDASRNAGFGGEAQGSASPPAPREDRVPAEPTGRAQTPAPEAPKAVPAPGQAFRTENNIFTDDLTPEQIEALFVAQSTRSAPRVGGTNVMDESDMDRLLKSLGGEAGSGYSAPRYAWLPSWAEDAPREPEAKPARRRVVYSAEDVYAEDTSVNDTAAEEVREIVLGLETTVATIDDTVVDARDMIRGLVEDVRSLQIQTNDVEKGVDVVKAQNAAQLEEIRELRQTVMTMRGHIATLIRLLTAQIPPPAASETPGKGDANIA